MRPTLRHSHPEAPDRPSLLPPVEAVDTIELATLPVFLAALAALQTRAAARMALAASPPYPAPEPAAETLLDARTAAARLGMSTDWLYRNKDKLPFTRRVGTRTVRFSESGITRWLATRARG
jgi:predicted DNA-binding transcriptional regulator AlpA